MAFFLLDSPTQNLLASMVGDPLVAGCELSMSVSPLDASCRLVCYAHLDQVANFSHAAVMAGAMDKDSFIHAMWRPLEEHARFFRDWGWYEMEAA